MSTLKFSADGQYLLHHFSKTLPYWSAETTHIPKDFADPTEIWHVETQQFITSVTGYLIGVSNDSSSFLTLQDEHTVGAWDIRTGESIPLDNISPDSYEHFQRISIFRGKSGYRLVDAFDELPPVAFDVPDSPLNMVLGPRLWLPMWFDLGYGAEGAYGQAIDITTGEVVWTFTLGRHEVNVPIYYSLHHNTVFVSTSCKAYNTKLEQKAASLRSQSG